jgi:hypothetical protein
MRVRETQSSRGARLEGWAAPWFETPRTRLRNRGGPEIAAPHHEAERDRVCIKLTGIRIARPSAPPRLSIPRLLVSRCLFRNCLGLTFAPLLHQYGSRI